MINACARRLFCTFLALTLAMAACVPGFAEGAGGKAVKIKARGVTLPIGAVRLSIGVDGKSTSAEIKYKIQPSNADANTNPKLIQWVSSNPSIAEVDKNGIVRAKAMGSCKITAKLLDGSDLSGSCGVVVGKQKVTKVTLDWSKKTLLPGRDAQLTASFQPKNAFDTGVGYKSTNTKVATVDKDGTVTAVGFGKCSIVATNKKSGSKASAELRVGYDYTGVKFRYYGIINSEYPDQVGKARYLRQSGSEFGGLYRKRLNETGFNIAKTYENLTLDEMRQAIKGIANNGAIGKGDVTVFYFAGRAERYGPAKDRGALLGVDQSAVNNALSIQELQEQLDNVPGTVVLVIDSDMSGKFIKGIRAPSNKGGQVSDEQLFNQSVIRQFSGSGAGVGTGADAKAISGAQRSKYKILCASGASQLSLYARDTDKEAGFSYFSYHLAKGIESGAADKNKDGSFSIAEVGGYVRAKVNAELKKANARDGKKRTQTVTLWPKSDRFPLYYRAPSNG